MKKYLAASVAVLAMLIVPSAAQAWHVQAQCVQNGSTITATAQWYGFTYGHDSTYLEIWRVNRQTDQWRKVAEFQGTGLASSVSYTAGVIDEFTGKIATTHRVYVAKAWFDVAEGGAHKSADCVIPPPVYDCKGNPVPPGTPVPPPEMLCPPPPVTPPQPPVPPIPPVVVPPTPNPPVTPKAKRCVPPYKITVSRGPTQYRFRFRNRRGKLVQAVWFVDGKRAGRTKVLKVKRGGVNRTVVARHGVFPRNGSCAAQWVKPRRSTPPRTVG